MKKMLPLTLVFFVFFTGCTKHEPDPVIVNISAGETENLPMPEILGIDFNNLEVSDTEFTVTDVNSLLETDEEVEKEPDVIFVPTPNDVVDKMLELANVQKDDLVYDLGCGDGRIVVRAAKRFGCKAVGYDIDPERVKESLENVAKNNVGHLVTIEQKDIFKLDLSKANVITLYLLPSLNVKLIPQLEKLRPGSRIVSHDFSMEGVKPDKIVEMISVEGEHQHTVYLWTTPLKKTKENKQTTDDEDFELEFDNEFYEISELPDF